MKMDELNVDYVTAPEPDAQRPGRYFELSSGMQRLVKFSKYLAIAAIIAGCVQAVLYAAAMSGQGLPGIATVAGELLGLKNAFIIWLGGMVLLLALRLVAAPEIPPWVPRLDAHFVGRARALTMAAIVIALLVLVAGVLGGFAQAAWMIGRNLQMGGRLGSEWLFYAAVNLLYYISAGVWHCFLLLAAALVARTLLTLSRRIEERAHQEKEGAA